MNFPLLSGECGASDADRNIYTRIHRAGQRDGWTSGRDVVDDKANLTTCPLCPVSPVWTGYKAAGRGG